MPKRLLDDGLLNSPSLGELSFFAEAMFPRLLLVADDFGCFDANPLVVAGRIWPLRREIDPEQIRAGMVELATAKTVRLWADGGRWYGYFTGWNGTKGQRKREEYSASNPKGSRRKTPPPPDLQDTKSLELYAFSEKPSNSHSRQFPDFPAARIEFPAPAVAVAVAVPVAVTGTTLPPPAAPVAASPPKAAKTKSQPNPRHTPLRQKAEAEFRAVRNAEMAWSGAEASALTRLLGYTADDGEILRRFRMGLRARGYPGVNSLCTLAQPDRWNALAGPAPPRNGAAGVLAPATEAEHDADRGRDVTNFTS